MENKKNINKSLDLSEFSVSPKKKSTKNFILAFSICFLFLAGYVYATNYVTEKGVRTPELNVSNVSISGNGNLTFYDGNSYRGVSSGTADVVVCRGINAFDDIYKSVKWVSGCDVVCKSTDNDCSLKLNSSVTSNMYMVWKGNFNSVVTAGTAILFRDLENVTIDANDAVINGLMGSANDEYLIQLSNVRNFRIVGLHILGNKSCGTNCIGLYVKNSNDVYLDNIDIRNVKGFQLFLGTLSGNSNNINVYNSYFKGLGINDVIGGGPNGASEIMSNVNIHHNTCIQTNELGSYANCIDLVGGDYYDFSFNYANGSILFGSETKRTANSKINYNTINYINGSMLGQIGSNTGDSFNDEFIGNIINNPFSGVIATLKGHHLTFKDNIINGGSTCIYIYGNNILVDGNTINNCSYAEYGNYILTEAGVSFDSIINNVLNIPSDSVQNGDLGITISPSNSNHSVLNNIFNNEGVISRFIRVSGNNSAYLGSVFLGNPGTDDQVQVLDTDNYVDNYAYTGTITQTCAVNSVFNERTIHNSTDSCTCTGGAWKCWAMS
jgi:hypothetical protein